MDLAPFACEDLAILAHVSSVSSDSLFIMMFLYKMSQTEKGPNTVKYLQNMLRRKLRYFFLGL